MMVKKYRFSTKGIFIAVFLLLVLLAVYFLYGHFSKPVVLEFGTFVGSLYDVPNWQSYKAIDHAIEKFEQTHPNIKIKYRSGILKNDYSEWLAQKVIKGMEPDVFCVLPGDFNTFASIGVLRSLDDYIARDKEFSKDRLYENALQFGRYGGRQYALPKELDPELMFVNKSLLQKSGIEIPKEGWTWKDLYDICKEVTKDTDGDGELDQFGVVGFNWQHAVYTNGQQLFDPNGTKAKFTEEGVVEAIRYINSLNKLNGNNKVSLEDFDEGKVAFRPFPLSAYRTYKVYPYKVMRYGEFDWECIKLPRGPKGNNASQLNSFLIGVGSRSKHRKEAWEFLKFLTYDRDIQMDVFRYSHGMPVLKAVVDSPEADAELSKYNSEGRTFIDKRVLGEVVEQSTVIPRFHKYEECMDIADKEIFQLINTGEDIDQRMRMLNNELNKFLKQ